MPGAVANAVIPTVDGHALVLPQALCRAFTESRGWAARVNEYHDGTTQRQALVSTSRRSWRLTERLAPSDAAALRAFLLAHPADAFYFYDPKEPAFGQLEGSNYDGTGISVTGRYTVRLQGDLEQQIYMARSEIGIELVEVA